MDDVEELHDGGAVVGDGDVALVVVNELVHSPGTQRGPHHVRHGRAGVDVAHQLRLPLRRVRPFLQQYDLRLLFFVHAFSQTVCGHTDETESVTTKMKWKRRREREIRERGCAPAWLPLLCCGMLERERKVEREREGGNGERERAVAKLGFCLN